MIVHGNRMAHIEERVPRLERRFVGWRDNPWTPEQMAATIRQYPKKRVFWRSRLDAATPEVAIVSPDSAPAIPDEFTREQLLAMKKQQRTHLHGGRQNAK